MRFNFFPAELAVGESWWPAARVIADDEGKVHAFVTNPATGKPWRVASARLTAPLDGRRLPNVIATEGGPWRLSRARHCHCRDPLKRTGPERLLALAAAA